MEKYLTEVTEFYKTIISIQFSTIAVVLAVAFIYVHTVSKQQATDMATEALESRSFTTALEHTFKEIEHRLHTTVEDKWIDFHNSSVLEHIRADHTSLLERIAFVEQVMDAYTSAGSQTGLTIQEKSKGKD